MTTYHAVGVGASTPSPRGVCIRLYSITNPIYYVDHNPYKTYMSKQKTITLKELATAEDLLNSRVVNAFGRNPEFYKEETLGAMRNLVPLDKGNKFLRLLTKEELPKSIVNNSKKMEGYAKDKHNYIARNAFIQMMKNLEKA